MIDWKTIHGTTAVHGNDYTHPSILKPDVHLSIHLLCTKYKSQSINNVRAIAKLFDANPTVVL